MEQREELRAYFFQNMYLQGIHAGIQSQHCTAEMFLKYKMDESYDDTRMLYTWARDYKTTIVLNGGYASNLLRLKTLLSSPDNPYPWAFFRESDEALGGCITNVGIILPEKVFNYKSNLAKSIKSLDISKMLDTGNITVREDLDLGLSNWEISLAKELGQCRLMS